MTLVEGRKIEEWVELAYIAWGGLFRVCVGCRVHDSGLLFQVAAVANGGMFRTELRTYTEADDLRQFVDCVAIDILSVKEDGTCL
jgi:hypothetical protein